MITHIQKADVLVWLAHQSSESVDLIITDPPYESLEKHRKVGTTTRLKGPWFPIVPNSYFPAIFKEFYRILRPNRHFYMFCDAETMFLLKPVAEKAEFYFWKPLVWDKVAIGMGYHYRAQTEFILFFEKGKRALRNKGTSDLLRAKRVVRGYPTQKPVGIVETLITQSSNVGEVVCDPFVGSGTTAAASLRLGRSFKGCDSSEVALQTNWDRLVSD
jgi:site-specific DNA-methyltransferase (adenine-specific)